MKNPFAKKKLSTSIQNVHSVIIANNNNVISGPISSLSSITTPIPTMSSCSTGASGWGYASAATFTYMNPEEMMKRRKAELMKEYEQNPELFSEIIVELRKEKIRQLKNKSQIQ